MNRLLLLTAVFLLTTTNLACGELESPRDNSNDKEDTGYFSDRAVELDAQFSSVIEIDLATQDYLEPQYRHGRTLIQEATPERFLEVLLGMKDDNLEQKLERLVTDDRQLWQASSLIHVFKQWVEQQISIANRQIVEQSVYHPNLQDGDLVIQDASLDGTVLRFSYTTTLEMLALKESLKEEGLTLDDIVSQEVPARVLADPTRLFDRLGDSCATNVEGELDNENYFYYFDVDKCQAEKVDAKLTIRKALPEANTYPEYDRLVADGEITVVMFHGIYEAAEEGDYGVREWKEFKSWLQLPEHEFRYVGPVMHTGVGAPFELGERWTRTRKMVDGRELTVTIDSISPYDQERVTDAEALFSSLFAEHELVMFNGHSGYGSMAMLDKPDTYRPNIYQIVLMNACWSYEYYTKQIILNKKTGSDPTGWKDVDIVNNSQAGNTHQRHEISSRLLSKLLEGAEFGGWDRQRNYHYSWQNIISELNAIGTIGQVYGASAVRDNDFRPSGD